MLSFIREDCFISILRSFIDSLQILCDKASVPIVTTIMGTGTTGGREHPWYRSKPTIDMMFSCMLEKLHCTILAVKGCNIPGHRFSRSSSHPYSVSFTVTSYFITFANLLTFSLAAMLSTSTDILVTFLSTAFLVSIIGWGQESHRASISISCLLFLSLDDHQRNRCDHNEA